MKKILSLLTLCLAVVIAASAQQPQITYAQPPVRTTLSPRNLVNTDTLAINFYGVGDNVKGFQITAVKVSGTVAGKIYLQGTLDGVAWVKIDSLVLADVSTPQTKIVIPAHTTYNSYQAYAITSGTQSYTPYFTVLRRPNEAY